MSINFKANEKTTSFYKEFQNVGEFECQKCRIITTHNYKLELLNISAKKFVIVNVNNFYWKENINNTYSRTIINSKLKDYDAQIIKLPILNVNKSETLYYKINSIIIRHD